MAPTIPRTILAAMVCLACCPAATVCAKKAASSSRPPPQQRLAAAHKLYEGAHFAEAARKFRKVLRPQPMAAVDRQLTEAGLGPLQLAPYRREFARSLVVTGDYAAAQEQLDQMRQAADSLPSPSLHGRFESDVLREEARVLQCLQRHGPA